MEVYKHHEATEQCIDRIKKDRDNHLEVHKDLDMDIESIKKEVACKVSWGWFYTLVSVLILVN